MRKKENNFPPVREASEYNEDEKRLNSLHLENEKKIKKPEIIPQEYIGANENDYIYEGEFHVSVVPSDSVKHLESSSNFADRKEYLLWQYKGCSDIDISK